MTYLFDFFGENKMVSFIGILDLQITGHNKLVIRVKCISKIIHLMCLIIIKQRFSKFNDNDLQIQIGKQTSYHA